MADPVYLEPGVSYDPVASANPEEGAQFTTGQSMAASWQEARDVSGASDVAQLAQKYSDYAQAGIGAALPGLYAQVPQFLSGTDATKQFGVQGPTPETTLKWDPSETVSTGVAAAAQKIMQDKIQDDLVMSHRPQTYTSWGATEGSDLLANAVDPTNLAFALMPEAALGKVAQIGAKVAGTADAAAAAARLSDALSDTVIGRMANSGVNNAAAVGLLQPIIQAGAEQDHMDYGWAQAGQNILFGGLLGAGLHGLGEGASALSGATWRASMRSGISSLDGENSAALMNEDLQRADRATVVDDLTGQDGTLPSDEAVTQEMQARQATIYDKIQQGRYFKPLPDQEPIDAATLPPDEIADRAASGDYEGAAQAMESHVNSMESELDLQPEEKEQANQPLSQFDQIKNVIGDFTDCVSQTIT